MGASGAVTLLESHKDSGNMLKTGVVETLIQESPILEMLPMTSFVGAAYETNLEYDLPDPEFRQVNATYNRSFGTDRKVFWGVAILGGEVFVDNFIVRTRGNVVDTKAKQYRKFAKAMARTFDQYFFDGTGTANDFKGVNTLIGEGFGQVYGANGDNANGGALSLDDLDVAHDLIRSQSSPDAILANRTHRRKITKLARDTSTGFSLIDVGDDKFGNQVTQWNGIGIRIIGDDRSGNAILDFDGHGNPEQFLLNEIAVDGSPEAARDETRGTGGAVKSSLYMIAFGEEENVHGLMGAGGTFEVVDFGETEAAPGHLGRVEAYPGICIANPYSVVRVNGITNA